MEKKEDAVLRNTLIQTANAQLATLCDTIPDEPLGSYKGAGGAESEGIIVEFNNNTVIVSRKGTAVDILEECIRAIAKIDEGTYGECDECQEPINPRRLKIYHYSVLCTKCKGEKEKTNHMNISVSNKGPQTCVSIQILKKQMYAQAYIAHS